MSASADIAIAITVGASIATGGIAVHIWHFPVLTELKRDVSAWRKACAAHVMRMGDANYEILGLQLALVDYAEREEVRKAQCRRAAELGREAQKVKRLDPQARQTIRDMTERLRAAPSTQLRPREDIAAEAEAALAERRERLRQAA